MPIHLRQVDDMNSIVSFTESPSLCLLRFAVEAIDGIDKGLMIYYQMPGNKLVVQSALKTQDREWEIQSINTEEFFEYFRNERQRKGQYQWLGTEDLPFEVSNRNSLTIFDELDRNILLLRFPDESDQASNLLYLYFNPRYKSTFLTSEKQSFTTSEKSLMAQIIHRNLSTFLNWIINEKKSFEQFVSHTQHLAIRFQNEKSKVELFEKRAGQSLVEFSNDILLELSQAHHKKANLSPAAEVLIRNFSGKISELKEILSNAFYYSLLLNRQNQEIIIEEWQMNIENTYARRFKPQSLNKERFGRAGELLSRLELAAQNVLNEHLPLTGKNLGNHCEKPISAPAISEALKKHKSEIIELLTQYPEQWPILREEFTPIKNILVSSTTKTNSKKVS